MKEFPEFDFDRAGLEPVVLSLPGVEIPRGQVLKRLGYPTASFELGEPVGTLFEKSIEEARPLLRPEAVVRVVRIASNDGAEVRFTGEPFVIRSPQVARLLRSSQDAVFLAATVGAGVDEAVSAHTARGDMLAAVFLDAIGSETVEAAADEAHWNLLRAAAERRGRAVTPRFSPGYGDWPVTVQADLAGVCGAARISIRVTPSSLMVPRKSVTAVLGLAAPGTAAGAAPDDVFT